MSGNDGKTKTQTNPQYTVDAENTGSLDMPSVTKLLNRKSLKKWEEQQAAQKKKGAAPQPQAPTPSTPPPAPAATPAIKPPVHLNDGSEINISADAPSEIQIESHQIGKTNVDIPVTTSQPQAAPAEAVAVPEATETVTAAPDTAITTVGENDATQVLSAAQVAQETDSTEMLQPPASAPQQPAAPAASPTKKIVVKNARRASKEPAKPLLEWNSELLSKSGDGMAQGLVHLFAKNAIQSALFLATQPPAAGKSIPQFIATAAVKPGNRQVTWTGLRWDPEVVPELWNHFIQHGMVELTPPGTQTTISSARNVVRAAFGIDQGEWLTLIRIGPLETCRGVVAAVSTKTITDEVAALTQYFFAALQKQAG